MLRMYERCKNPVVLSYAIFVLLPWAFLAAMQFYQGTSDVLILVSQSAFFGWIVVAYILVDRLAPWTFLNTLARRILSILAATCYLSVYFLMGYWLYTGHRFDPFFLLDSYREVLPTARTIFGEGTLLKGVAISLFLWGLSYLLVNRTFSYVQQKHIRFGIRSGLAGSLMLVISIANLPSAYGSFYESVQGTLEARNKVPTAFIDTSMYDVRSNENVIILQLESINALAAMGKSQVGKKTYEDNYIPHMTAIARDGIFFPFFWSSTVQTNRAMEAIFCGAIANIKKAYSFRLSEIAVDCMPKILADHGYETYFFRSDDLSFTNMGNFAKKVGFTQVHQKDIMQPEDKEYKWGYDDCTVYKRAFEYLDSSHDEKKPLFAYFEVSSHHHPFTLKKEYADMALFDEPSNFIEKYINSMQSQDFCVSVFYEYFRKYDDGNTHLFVFPDTSWPVGIHMNTYNEKGAYNDNFLTPLVYIPPRNRMSEYHVGKVVDHIYGQTDVLPTIFNLLNPSAEYQNSFLFELEKDEATSSIFNVFEGKAVSSPQYEDCYVLTQPYGGTQIAVIRAADKYVYNFSSKNVMHFDVQKDVLERRPEQVEKNMDYEQFVNEYFCDRFKEEVSPSNTKE